MSDKGYPSDPKRSRSRHGRGSRDSPRRSHHGGPRRDDRGFDRGLSRDNPAPNIVYIAADYPQAAENAGPYGPTEVARRPSLVEEDPPDFFWLNIFALFCFLPLGVIGIVMSVRCGRAADRGDLRAACQYSFHARDYGTAAIVFGFQLLMLIIGYYAMTYQFGLPVL